MTNSNETITFEVISSFKNIYPRITPKIGIKNATWDWKITPLFFKMWNLNNHATPVGKTPRYNNAIIESKLGDRFQGCSKNIEIGNTIIDPQINIEAVTFSFFFLLIF